MKIGIVLSGGAARGIAHIGILKALNELGIKPDVISGTSAGAIIGAYYAAGFTPDEILRIASATNMFRLSDILFNKGGLFKASTLRFQLEKNLKGLTFEELKLPLFAVATDFTNASSYYFSSGEIIPALLASSAIPGLYQPVEHKSLTLVDGGLLNNLPTEPLTGICDIIIGCHVNPIDKNMSNISIREAIDRSVHIAIGKSVREKEKLCHLFIEPPQLSKYGLFDLNKATELFNIGYHYTLKFKEDIEKLLNNN